MGRKLLTDLQANKIQINYVNYKPIFDLPKEEFKRLSLDLAFRLEDDDEEDEEAEETILCGK